MQTENEPNGEWNEAIASSAHAEAVRAHPPRMFTEMLPVMLTATELLEKAKKASAARQRVAEFEAQKKATADHWKAKIELAENERDSHLDAIALGVEDREVECVETFEWRTGVVTVSRADTGEKIRERAMTTAERQPALFDPNDEQLSLDDAVDSDADELSTPDVVITDPEAVLGDDNGDAPKPKRRRKSS